MDIKQAKEALRRTYLVYTERDEFGSLRIPAEQRGDLDWRMMMKNKKILR